MAEGGSTVSRSSWSGTKENVYKFWKARFDRSVMLPLMMAEITK